MQLIKGKSYHCVGSSLYVRVVQIHYESEVYYKAKAELITKASGLVQVKTKNYKLFKDMIAHWKEYKPTKERWGYNLY